MSKLDDLRPLLSNVGAQRLMDVFADKDKEIRFIGGSVRDVLLKRPINDIDLATNALPDESLEILKAANIQTIATGLAHGTVTAIVDREPYQITSLRQDVKTDGRHAEVEFTADWNLDAQRRDFTVNALSVDKKGNFFDCCQGLEDLENKCLRFIGDPRRRIEEDYLRILRYFRFASQLDWELDNETELNICSELAPNLTRLSRERIQSEIYKILLGKNCLKIVTLMRDLKIWKPLIDIDPNIQALQNLLIISETTKQKSALRRFLALFGYDDMEALETILVLTNKDKKRIKDLQVLKQYDEQDYSLNKMLYDFGSESVKDYYFLENEKSFLPQINTWEKPVFPLKASDIMPFNKGADSLLGRTLSSVENYWVDHDFEPTKQQLLNQAKELLAGNQ